MAASEQPTDPQWSYFQVKLKIRRWNQTLYHHPKKSDFSTKALELNIYNLYRFLQEHFDEESSGEVDLEALALMLGVEKVANKESTSSSPSPPGDQ